MNLQTHTFRLTALASMVAACFSLGACGGGGDGSTTAVEATKANDAPVTAANTEAAPEQTIAQILSVPGPEVQLVSVPETPAAPASDVVVEATPAAMAALVEVDAPPATAQESNSARAAPLGVVAANPSAAPASPEEPAPSLANLPVSTDLLARLRPTPNCALGYVAGSAPAVAASTALNQQALTYTAAELPVWRARVNTGPFIKTGDFAPGSPGDWARIRANADALVSGAEAILSVRGGDPARSTHGTKARDAAFAFLITQRAAYAEAVRKHLLAQANNPANDFTQLCMRELDGSVRDAWYGEATWLLRHIVAYDQVRSALPTTDRVTIEAWFRRNAAFFAAQLDWGNGNVFPNRLQGDYLKRASAAAAKGNAIWATRKLDTNGDCKVDAADDGKEYTLNRYTTANGTAGPQISYLSQWFNNRKSSSAVAIGAAGVVLGDPELTQRAKRYFFEWLTYGVAADGSDGEYLRNLDYCIPRQGAVYSTMNIQAALLFGDWMARRGDNAMFKFSTRDGLFETASATGQSAKSLALVTGTYLKLINQQTNWYAHEPFKPVQQPRAATHLGNIESFYNKSARGTDNYHELGFMAAVKHLPQLPIQALVLRDTATTALRYPGSTGHAVATGYGSWAGAWTDAFNVTPSLLLTRQ